MNFRITVLGSHPFSLAYEDNELKDIIGEYIKLRKEKGHPRGQGDRYLDPYTI